jgi:hypothetical protein
MKINFAIYRITPVMKVKTEIIASLSANPIA